MNRLTASVVPRALACPGSLHLEQHDEKSDEAAAGVARHAEAEAAIDTGAEAEVLHPRILRALRGDRRTEAAYVYDVASDSARRLDVSRRAYGDMRPTEIPGTIDLVCVDELGAVVVDHKGYASVGAAVNNAQLATYALMVARAHGVDHVTVAINYLGTGACSIGTLSAFDLDAHAGALRKLVVDAPTTLVSGGHCRHCPSFHVCPEQHRIAASLKADVAWSLDQPADLFDLIERAKLWVKRAESALYRHAESAPVTLHDGRTLGVTDVESNEKIDPAVALAVVTELHGAEAADRALARTATKTALSKLPGVIEEIRKRGGIKRTTKREVAIH